MRILCGILPISYNIVDLNNVMGVWERGVWILLGALCIGYMALILLGSGMSGECMYIGGSILQAWSLVNLLVYDV